MIAHHTDVRSIHFLEVLHILQKDIDMDDVIQIRADRLQHDLE
jgi:hypothetical protein